jgi:hypothetical protein
MTTQLADPISPGEFLSAAPHTSYGGNTPWAARYAVEVRRLWRQEAEQAPRSLQAHLGPSELGVECDRQVAGKFAGLPRTNHVVDPWPSTRGRALHRHAEDVFGLDNLVTGFQRWSTERKVVPHPEHSGTADLYDHTEQAVLDHKFLGESTMVKIRKDPPRKYKRQLMLYGLGYFLEGYVVRRIVILAYPATSASLDGLYVWEHPWGDENGPTAEVEAELRDTFVETERRKAQGAGIADGRWRFEDVPAVPDSDECYFCDFYRPQAGRDGGPGCPGTVSGS